MWNKLLPDGNPNDQSRHGGMANARRVLIGIWSLVIGHWFISGPAWAHGDDDVTALSLLGPLILVAVLAAGLGIGRPLARWLARRG